MLERVRGGWSVRIRYGAGERTRLRLPDLPEPTAKERVRRLERIAALLAPTGRHAEARIILHDAAQQANEKAFAAAEAVAREVAEGAGAEPPSSAPKTFRDVAELWLSGELHRRYPDDVAPKSERSVEATRAVLSVVYPELGEMPLSKITLDHAERAKALVPSTLARNSRRHYAIAIRRVLALAVYPLRLLEQSPIPPRFVPRMAGTRKFPFLYPDEDAQLLRCKRILPSDRLMYGLLARTGLRVSEAAALSYANIDFRKGVLRLEKNKTRRPRSFRLPPDVLRALQAFRNGSELVFPEFRYFNCARRFREDLLGAELDRFELHNTTAERRRMRIHDLRGTFVTLALAAGATETWVMDRTGHTTSAMLNVYRRDARHASELELGWFEPLDWAMGLGQRVGHEPKLPWKSAADHTPSWSPKRSMVLQNEPKTSAEVTPRPVSDRSGPAEIAGVGQSAIELSLAESLRKAIDAERWELAQDIARELGERRRERTAPSVPSLEAARSRKTK